MERFRKAIDKQIENNRGKNIFFGKPGIFHFVSDTVDAISGIKKLDIINENILIDYATDKSLEEFCRINQY